MAHFGESLPPLTWRDLILSLVFAVAAGVYWLTAWQMLRLLDRWRGKRATGASAATRPAAMRTSSAPGADPRARERPAETRLAAPGRRAGPA